MFFPYMRLRPKYAGLFVSNDTEIVIEGYPRSANTFATAAFEYAQGRKVMIARHLHAPAQIQRAVEYEIPIILLVRAPIDAIISFVIREPRVSIYSAIRAYANFYRSTIQYADQVVIGTFEEITKNYSQVIRRVNKKYGKNFEVFGNTQSAVSNVFNIVEEMEKAFSGGEMSENKVARPSEQRSELKSAIARKLENLEDDLLLKECHYLHEAFLVVNKRQIEQYDS
jgi:hypothetical protein